MVSRSSGGAQRDNVCCRPCDIRFGGEGSDPGAMEKLGDRNNDVGYLLHTRVISVFRSSQIRPLRLLRLVLGI